MKVRDAYRYYLENGMHSMLAVSIHMFTTVGNGLDWKNGELCYEFGEVPEDWYEGPRLIEISEDCSASLRSKWLMENEVRKVRRNFVISNLETILESPVDSPLFESDHSLNCTYLRHPSKYSKSLVFPDDLTEEWADAIVRFNDWWMVSFRHFYGVKNDGTIDFWKDEVKNRYLMIEEAMKRAFEIANGISYEQHERELSELINDLM